MNAHAAAVMLATGLCVGPGAGAQPVTYQLTPTHSFVHFSWDHAGLSTLRGRFDHTRGRVVLDRRAQAGQAQVNVRTASVNTGRPVLDAALREALAAGATPDDEGQAVLRVTVDELRFDGDRPVAARARLQWRGQPVDMALSTAHFNCYLNPLLRREVCGGEFRTTLDPAVLGPALDAAFGLRGPLALQLQVEAVRQEAAP